MRRRRGRSRVMRRWWRRWWRGRPRRVGKIRDALGGASVFVSAAVVWDGVGVSGVWAAVLVGSGAVVGLAANGAIMNAGGNCDYCGSPIGFYGCPKHGTDCYNPPYPDIGQPCGGFGCDG